MELQRPAPDGLAVQGGDQEQPGGRGQLVVIGGDAPRRVEAAIEAPGQLAEIGPQAEPGIRPPGVAPGDPHRRGSHQPLHPGNSSQRTVPEPACGKAEQ